jgi:uncharacterized protein YndB with AHSA1/START domain
VTDSPTTASDRVVIARSLAAPATLVWAMWTDPEHFAAWYGPTGASIPVAEFDVRVGGIRRVCMEVQVPDGAMRMWFHGEHTQVDPHRLLSYTEQVTDEAGAPTHGDLTEVRVELEETDGRTRMVMTHLGIPEGSPGAAGWQMALDKLEAHLDPFEQSGRSG